MPPLTTSWLFDLATAPLSRREKSRDERNTPARTRAAPESMTCQSSCEAFKAHVSGGAPLPRMRRVQVEVAGRGGGQTGQARRTFATSLLHHLYRTLAMATGDVAQGRASHAFLSSSLRIVSGR